MFEMLLRSNDLDYSARKAAGAVTITKERNDAGVIAGVIVAVLALKAWNPKTGALSTSATHRLTAAEIAAIRQRIVQYRDSAIARLAELDAFIADVQAVDDPA